MSLVSVITPAFNAEATIARTVTSVLAQTHSELELIIVSDDGGDYLELLRGAGLVDVRLVQASTGKNGGGCHRARNRGLAAARGDFVLHLDADDVILPTKLQRLLPLARAHGAAYDVVRVVDDASGAALYDLMQGRPLLDLPSFFAATGPLIPLVRRDHASPRVEGLELTEEILANALLLDTLGPLPIVPEALTEYHVVSGSMCHAARAAERFEEAYTLALATLPMLRLSPSNRPLVHDGLVARRNLNRLYGEAAVSEPELNFQQFIARSLDRGEHA